MNSRLHTSHQSKRCNLFVCTLDDGQIEPSNDHKSSSSFAIKMRNKDKRLVHWSPSGDYSRSQSLDEEIGQNGTIYCQAVVQILFADSNQQWTVGQIGELVLYKSAPKRPVDASDLYLSFFASDRYRFLIKLSEGAKVWKNSKNFVAILHGRLIGLNFAIEHSQQAELLVKYMQEFQLGLIPPKSSERLLRAIKHWRKPQQSTTNNKQQLTMNSDEYALQKSTNFVARKKQIKIESNHVDELDPILQPREFLKQMSDCSASEDI